ncbi:hypothetical protein FHX37_2843 [Haloactinospora alba]|uniref:Uncharacterized protein n=1 Tax=Haloactinospora alba TaxID=405555 RepID=A0A543NLZ6_9ACTN|nr:DUF6221 family protein [Haloactinospora alba]TQN32858.1 hypothetical protein FHX37_2843 [Haloactinospora alba]
MSGDTGELAAFLREQLDLEEHQAWALLSSLMDSASASEEIDQRIEDAEREYGDRIQQDEDLTQDLLRAKSNQRRSDWNRKESASLLDEVLSMIEQARGVLAECERTGNVARLRKIAARYSQRPGYREEWAP